MKASTPDAIGFGSCFLMIFRAYPRGISVTKLSDYRFSKHASFTHGGLKIPGSRYVLYPVRAARRCVGAGQELGRRTELCRSVALPLPRSAARSPPGDAGLRAHAGLRK